MFGHVRSFAFVGIDAVPVDVRAQVSSGLPAFIVDGFPGKAGNETRDRVRAAIAAMGLALPPRRVAVSLSPVEALDDGRLHDLPIALAVLAAVGLLPSEELAGYAAVGSLFPDGTLDAVAGILPAAIAASGLELGLICPASQGGEAAWAGGVEVLAPADLFGVINHFRGTQVLSPPTPAGVRGVVPGPDLADLPGMETAKRALEIAAAGGHSLMLIGPAVVGKAALAARLPGLLPDLTPAEALEVSVIHSVAGLLDGGLLMRRPPFRAPPIGTSVAALVGGGERARPGEVSLAHLGVLYIDGLSECAPDTLEALRQSPGGGSATSIRGSARATYPSRHQLAVAAAPCRCGHLGDSLRECGDAPRCGKEHLLELDAALFGRIDMFVHVPVASAMGPVGAPAEEASAAVAERVRLARARRLARRGENVLPLSEHEGAADLGCHPEARELARVAEERLKLSAQDVSRLLRVARTIADLAGSRCVRGADVSEALAYQLR